MRAFLILLALLFFSVPAQAAVYLVTFSGSVDSTQGDVNSGDIAVGNSVSGNFLFDSDQAVFGAANPLGGGTSTTYFATLSNFELQIGSYSISSSSTPGTLYYQDDVFGSDGFGFAL